MAVTFNRFDSAEQAEQALVNELRLNFSVSPNGPAAIVPLLVMLPGGSTPLRVYRRIAADPPKPIHPTLHLMLSDDRHVNDSSPDSNYGHVRSMADSLRLTDTRLLHPRPELSLEEAAIRYDADIAEAESRNARFALAVLGIGNDGHTASLFTPGLVPITDDAQNVQTPRALAIPDRAGFDRISVSAEVILRFERVVFFAVGAAKHDILYEISRRPEDYPAGRIAMQHNNSVIWTDQGIYYE